MEDALYFKGYPKYLDDGHPGAWRIALFKMCKLAVFSLFII